MLFALSLLAGCAVGPDYKKPDDAVPATYKEAGDWVVAKPADAAPKGEWWRVFKDPVLDALDRAGEREQPELCVRPRRATTRRAPP